MDFKYTLLNIWDKVVPILTILVVIAVIGGCSVGIYKGAKHDIAEAEQNDVRCTSVYNAAYDDVALEDIRYCEHWFASGDYSEGAPKCNYSLAELEGMESWPIKCRDAAELISLEPPKEDGNSSGDVHIEKNGKVVVE